MDRQEIRETIKGFQTPRVTRAEELFAKIFTQDNSIRLFFINENDAYTDGSTVVVDPARDKIFCDKKALRACELYLGLPTGFLTKDPFMALRMITRGQTIHECLHLIYTTFPLTYLDSKVPQNENEKNTLQTISNIIEDAYIEAVGRTVYDNLDIFLILMRVSIFYSDAATRARKRPSNQFFDRAENEPLDSGKFLLGYVNYFIDLLLYPFSANLEVPEQIKEYVEATRDLFYKGCMAPTPELRQEYADKILVAIRPLIPPETKVDFSSLNLKLSDAKTHSGASLPGSKERTGKPQEVDNSLFGDDKDEEEKEGAGGSDEQQEQSEGENQSSTGQDQDQQGQQSQQDQQSQQNQQSQDTSGPSGSTSKSRKKKDEIDKILKDESRYGSKNTKKKVDDFNKRNNKPLSDALKNILMDFKEEKADNEYDNNKEKKEPPTDELDTILPESLNAPESHSKVKILQRKLVSTQDRQDEYDEIRKKYKDVISLYKRRFAEIIRSDVDYQEDRFLFGSGINSKYLSDPSKRYWYRNRFEEDTPELSVLLIIDGSGSMYGKPRLKCRDSCIILHEVLKSLDIKHSVVEHRAYPYDWEIGINLLLGFGAPDKDKYNLLRVDAEGENRDGLALLWGERYISRFANTDNQLIIILSDGLPAHNIDNYYPPASVEDTKEIVKRIKKRGTNVIGIALDHGSSGESLENLREIYPDLVMCDELTNLPNQLLNLIAKELI